MKLKWNIDDRTLNAARKYCPINSTTPACQFGGFNFNTNTWEKRIRRSDKFCIETGKSSPQEIINAFKKKQYLQGLALVVCWGGMQRWQDQQIYCYPLDCIHNAIQQCADRICKTNSFADSWKILTDGNLKWSAVMTSKTLHFLCRALGFTEDPPVPIDSVIREKVWRAFRNSTPRSERPGNWEGDSFGAYSRYMTAILEWAKSRKWSSTDVEATLYDEYRQKNS